MHLTTIAEEEEQRELPSCRELLGRVHELILLERCFVVALSVCIQYNEKDPGLSIPTTTFIVSTHDIDYTPTCEQCDIFASMTRVA